MTFDDACRSVGYDPRDINVPPAVYKYFAYVEGNGVECSSSTEASNMSSLSERVQINKAEVHEYWANRAELERKASDIFHKALRNKYCYVSDVVYNRCYSEAYERSHSSGYDEVANHLAGYIDLAKDILDISKCE